jgi:hypothetical protein
MMMVKDLTLHCHSLSPLLSAACLKNRSLHRHCRSHAILADTVGITLNFEQREPQFLHVAQM